MTAAISSVSSNKVRLDRALVKLNLVATRSQAESYIHLGKVVVNDKIIKKAGYFVDYSAEIKLSQDKQFVSRAGLKLQSVADTLGLNFKDKIVLDVGSSTGGFTDFALTCGAKKVIAVDVGTDQMHPKLRLDNRVELYEKTDIRDFRTKQKIDLIMMDVSFISARDILPHLSKNFMRSDTLLLVMVKPQFEAGKKLKNSGVIKNDRDRRKILANFEVWARQKFLILNKADSSVSGTKGNKERFYLLKKL